VNEEVSIKKQREIEKKCKIDRRKGIARKRIRKSMREFMMRVGGIAVK